jgi:hypothetical protein
MFKTNFYTNPSATKRKKKSFNLLLTILKKGLVLARQPLYQLSHTTSPKQVIL